MKRASGSGAAWWTLDPAVRVPGFWWVLALALVVRLAWAWAVPVAPISDAAAYDVLTRNLVNGVGYSLDPNPPSDLDEVNYSAYWPVGTPAVYAGVISLTGGYRVPIVAVNILTAMVTIALVMRLAGGWFGGRAGTAAGVLLALLPGQFMFVTLMVSELMFAMGVVLSLWVWTRAAWPFWLRVVLTGVVLGGTCLVRPTALLFPFLFVLVRVVHEGHWKQTVAGAAVAAAAMGLVILPWTLRNQRVLGEAVLVSTNAGPNLWMGNSPGTDGGYRPLPPEVATMSEVERDTYLKDQAKAYIKGEPAAFVKRTGVKLIKLHDRETINVLWNAAGLYEVLGPQDTADAPWPPPDAELAAFDRRVLNPLKLFSTACWWGVAALGVVGGVMMLFRYGILATLVHPAVLFWGYFAAVHAVIVIQDRYHWPSVPFIAVLAALPVAAVWQRVSPREPREAGAAAGGGAAHA